MSRADRTPIHDRLATATVGEREAWFDRAIADGMPAVDLHRTVERAVGNPDALVAFCGASIRRAAPRWAAAIAAEPGPGNPFVADIVRWMDLPMPAAVSSPRLATSATRATWFIHQVAATAALIADDVAEDDACRMTVPIHGPHSASDHGSTALTDAIIGAPDGAMRTLVALGRITGRGPETFIAGGHALAAFARLAKA